MLAMPFASARPVEYDAYVPNSIQLDENTISDGPYQISSYVAGKSITFVRNPAWKQSTDTLRHDYPNSIVETLGVTSAQTQLADIQAGSQDLTSDTPVNPSSVPGLAASKASNFNIWPWSDTFPYLIFNLRSPNVGGAMQNVQRAPGGRVRHRQDRRRQGDGRPARRQRDQHGHPARQRRLRELQHVPG